MLLVVTLVSSYVCVFPFPFNIFCIAEFFNNNVDDDNTHHNNDDLDTHHNNDAHNIFKYIIWGKYDKMQENNCPKSIG